jgi:hypothetical protein
MHIRQDGLGVLDRPVKWLAHRSTPPVFRISPLGTAILVR